MTIDKDKMRCHYCHEFGHFIRDCLKRINDEKGTGKLNMMTPVQDHQEYEQNEDYDWGCEDEQVEHLNN